MADVKKKGLGKGLGALIGAHTVAGATTASHAFQMAGPRHDEPTLPDGTRLLLLDPEQLRPNPKQPRKIFDEEALQELSESIRRDGVQEPVIVRQVGDIFELVSGERRVRASIMAGLDKVPAVCRDISDRDMLKLGLIENIQRQDLNTIELAQAYQQLMLEFSWTQEEMAREVGKNRATIANVLRLLNLPEAVQDHVARGVLSTGHAKALLSLASANDQHRAARRIIEQGLSVRQTEKLVLEMQAPKPTPGGAAPKKDANVAQIEEDLRRSLGTRVALKTSSPDRGRIEIEYYSLDELERLLGVLKRR